MYLDDKPARKIIKLKWYQDNFILSPARYTAIVGGVGTGKTFAMLYRGWRYCERYPGSTGLVVRREYVDLERSTIRDFERYFNAKVSSGKYAFANGSVIYFSHGDTNDINALKNINLSWFLIEQAEEYDTAEVFDFLRDRLRQDHVGPRFGGIIANAHGHNWIYDRFIDGAKSVCVDASTGQYRYVKNGRYDCSTANTFANADNLPADFVEDLRAMKDDDPTHYRQYVLNDYNVVDADDLVFSPEDIQAMTDCDVTKMPLVRRYSAVDVARYGRDSSVNFVGGSFGGLHFGEVGVDGFSKKSLPDTVGRTLDFNRTLGGVDYGCMDADGIGGGAIDIATSGGHAFEEFHNLPLKTPERGSTQPAYANVRTKAYFDLKDWARKGWVSIKHPQVLAQLASARYCFNAKNQKMLIPKETLRAKGVKSPDYADAAAMCFWLYKKHTITFGENKDKTGYHRRPTARRRVVLQGW